MRGDEGCGLFVVWSLARWRPAAVNTLHFTLYTSIDIHHQHASVNRLLSHAHPRPQNGSIIRSAMSPNVVKSRTVGYIKFWGEIMSVANRILWQSPFIYFNFLMISSTSAAPSE